MCVALGPVLTLEEVINFSDLMLLSMAFPNIIGMVFLSKQVKTQLNLYLKPTKLVKWKLLNKT